MSHFLSLRSYSNENCSHSHDFAQLVLPIKGELEIEIDGKIGLVNETTGACIGSNRRHCFSSNQDNLFLVIDSPNTNSWHNDRLPLFLHLNDAIQKYTTFAHCYLMQKNDVFTQHLLYQLLMNLLTPDLHLTDHVVILAKQWIDRHVATPVNLTHLAQHCHLSKSQLQRRFKQSTGLSLGEYWLKKKLEYAQVLLSNNKLSIEDVAYQVGYENLSAFSRRFNQSFDLTPSQWRNMQFSAKNMRLADNKKVINS
ncbi:helix-turn-helix domain-containing protein [Legionella cardiaca]|uniref:AraC family transcriptional regulator n=1 Tax=Legionella cardiaca TaxID=1071983 RepID=A0ABY8AY41_9GAMM|nr:AraC family transcriptional regulator [Legionella cardiaca]WED44032.1 AraC family transcriptional regulator [Legionella cardiaca]